jgi:uncharacterized membrane protein YfcA
MTGWIDFVLAGLAAVAAGLVNALAGGGTLITFPVLVALGIPPVVANVTNTVALCPGYLGATFAQSKDLRGQAGRMRLLLPLSAAGGIAGGYLLLHTGEKLFQTLVPFLILLATGLLASNDLVRGVLARRGKASGVSAAAAGAAASADSPKPQVGSPRRNWVPQLALALPVGLAAVYGGYFGAGLSVIVLAVLGLVLDDSITRLNALKQSVSFSVNIAAAIFFVFSGKVLWPVALVMMVGALAGGALGGRLAGKVKPAVLRWMVVSIGLVVSLIYFIRLAA